MRNLPALAFVTILLFAGTAQADIQGIPRVADGDSLEIAGQRVRLHGIDAPEAQQTCIANDKPWPCGEKATLALANEIAGQGVTCRKKDRDRYRRIVAVCYLGSKDLNALMVSEGWALAYRRYSMDYVDEEEAAKSEHKGVWHGEFVQPWKWRRGKRLADEPIGRRALGNCLIKGNINRKGEHIYHVPDGRWYDRTKIDLSKGERWFCTEEAARAAGWRAAR